MGLWVKSWDDEEWNRQFRPGGGPFMFYPGRYRKSVRATQPRRLRKHKRR